MYNKLHKIPAPQIEELERIAHKVRWKNDNVRLGANGLDNISVYSYSKWYDWASEQREAFKTAWDPALIGKSVVGWVLLLPHHVGHLDLMTCWQNAHTAGTVYARALADQEIVLGGKVVTVARGEGVSFNLRTPHQIIKRPTDQLWACVMTLES